MANPMWNLLQSIQHERVPTHTYGHARICPEKTPLVGAHLDAWQLRKAREWKGFELDEENMRYQAIYILNGFLMQ